MHPDALLERHIIIGNVVFRIAWIVCRGHGTFLPNHFEIDRLGTEKILDFAITITLPLATTESIANFQFLALVDPVRFFTTILNEFNRNIVREASVVLLQYDQPLPESLLPVGLGLFDQVNNSTNHCIAHREPFLSRD